MVLALLTSLLMELSGKMPFGFPGKAVDLRGFGGICTWDEARPVTLNEQPSAGGAMVLTLCCTSYTHRKVPQRKRSQEPELGRESMTSCQLAKQKYTERHTQGLREIDEGQG